MLHHKDHIMSVSPVSSSHVAPQPTTAPAPPAAPAANKNAAGTAANVAENSRPPPSPSPAPGTGLKVDKHA
jgi:hypothetical protein